MKNIRIDLETIKGAIRDGRLVYASFTKDGPGLLVKSARRTLGRVQVFTIEGWRVPVAVWTDYNPGTIEQSGGTQ